MDNLLPLGNSSGIAGYLTAFDEYVVPSGEFGRYSQLAEGIDDRGRSRSFASLRMTGKGGYDGVV